MITGSQSSRDLLGQHGRPSIEVAGETLPLEVGAWLARLLALEHLPFAYLVPDEAMLPPESLRCFHLDREWLRAAVDGFLAAGTPTAVERAALDEQYSDVIGELGLSSPFFRRSGFLLRSSLLVRWPGLRVEPAEAVVRRELLAPTLLLVVFDRIPASFSLIEPGGETTLAVRRGEHGFTTQRGTAPGAVARDLPARAGAAPGVLDWSASPGSALLAATLLGGLGAVAFGEPS